MALSQKTKKVLNIVVDIIVLIILAFAVIFAVSMISSRASGYDGYTVIFGKSYLAVRTDSMAQNLETGEAGEDNFRSGDLIIIRTVNKEEANNLEVGTVITFMTNEITEDEHYVLNTHRIIEANNGWYYTHGDNNPEGQNETVFADKIVGVYEGKIEGLGNFVLFMGSFGGFCTFVLVPSLIVVMYFGINLVLVIKNDKARQSAQAAEENNQRLAEEKEKIRQEILAELSAKQERGENKDDGGGQNNG